MRRAALDLLLVQRSRARASDRHGSRPAPSGDSRRWGATTRAARTRCRDPPARRCEREGHTRQPRRSPRCAAYREDADCISDLRSRRAAQLDLVVRKSSLIEQDYRICLEANDAFQASDRAYEPRRPIRRSRGCVLRRCPSSSARPPPCAPQARAPRAPRRAEQAPPRGARAARSVALGKLATLSPRRYSLFQPARPRPGPSDRRRPGAAGGGRLGREHPDASGKIGSTTATSTGARRCGCRCSGGHEEDVEMTAAASGSAR